MPRQSRSQAANILREVLGDPNIQIRAIPQGFDGEKFEVITSQGQKLFCRVKDQRESQELPYQEAEVLARIDSPHIIKPSRIDQVRSRYVMMRPYIEGTSLEERLRGTPLTSTELETLANTLFDCVLALSNAGAVHFDIKPANIVVGTDGRFYLIDFGAARFLKKMKTERIYPARKFIAPEVLEYLFKPTDLTFQRLTLLVDMYGVGAVLYTAASGHALTEFFQASSDVLQKVPPPVRDFAPNLNPQLAVVIDRLLSKEPARRLRPEDARTLLRDGTIPSKTCPLYFLKTKPGRGSEHAQMIEPIAQQDTLAGVYWVSPQAPKLPKKTASNNVIWETPWRDDNQQFQTDLLHQYEHAVFALCVPSRELENPTDPAALAANLSLIDIAIAWKQMKATHLPVIAVIAIDEALLNSAEISGIKDAYAPKNVDGIILRICMPDRTSFDVRHLRSVRQFIRPWAESGKIVLFDGDLSILPLSLYGVSGLVSRTYPRLNILASRRTRPSFATRPDGMYVTNFLSIVNADSVTGLRVTPLGRNLTNCQCPYCAVNFMHRNRLSRWERSDRRKHFISVIPREIRDIKNSSSDVLKQRIESAQREATRSRLTRLDLSALRVWLQFLQ